MSTNYYCGAYCHECGGATEEYHLGKRSAGAVFGFQGLRGYLGPNHEKDIKSAKDWEEVIAAHGFTIRSIPGDDMTVEEFFVMARATLKFAPTHNVDVPPDSDFEDYYWLDEEKFSFTFKDFS